MSARLLMSLPVGGAAVAEGLLMSESGAMMVVCRAVRGAMSRTPILGSEGLGVKNTEVNERGLTRCKVGNVSYL